MSEKLNVHKNLMAEKHCNTENIFTTPGMSFTVALIHNTNDQSRAKLV